MQQLAVAEQRALGVAQALEGDGEAVAGLEVALQIDAVREARTSSSASDGGRPAARSESNNPPCTAPSMRTR